MTKIALITGCDRTRWCLFVGTPIKTKAMGSMALSVGAHYLIQRG